MHHRGSPMKLCSWSARDFYFSNKPCLSAPPWVREFHLHDILLSDEQDLDLDLLHLLPCLFTCGMSHLVSVFEFSSHKFLKQAPENMGNTCPNCLLQWLCHLKTHPGMLCCFPQSFHIASVHIWNYWPSHQNVDPQWLLLWTLQVIKVFAKVFWSPAPRRRIISGCVLRSCLLCWVSLDPSHSFWSIMSLKFSPLLGVDTFRHILCFIAVSSGFKDFISM